MQRVKEIEAVKDRDLSHHWREAAAYAHALTRLIEYHEDPTPQRWKDFTNVRRRARTASRW